MYFIYFPYVIGLSIFLLIDSMRQKASRWWALLVFFAPVTTPFYFMLTRSRQAKKPIIIFCATLVVVIIAEALLYSSSVTNFMAINYSPVAKQLIVHAKELKASTNRLDDAIEKLESLSKVESRLSNIGDTLQMIGQMRVLLIQHKADYERLIRFATEYAPILEKEGLGWLLTIEKYYNNPIVERHTQSLYDYLDAFEALLEYTFDNFDKIESRSQVHLKNYDAYYMKYRHAVDSHNKINIRRIHFQNTLLEKNPRLKPYLPSTRQTDFLKLWG